MVDQIKKFWQSIEADLYLVVALTVVGLVSAGLVGFAKTLPQLILGGLLGGLTHLIITALTQKRFSWQLEGFTWGLLAALILPAGYPIQVAVTAVLAAGLAEVFHGVIKSRDYHVFQPAVLSLVLVARWSGLTLGFWGDRLVILVILLGLLNVIKQQRLIQVGSALVSFTVAALIARLNFRLADISWLFWLFLVADAKSSLSPGWLQVIYGLVVGLASVLYTYTPFRDFASFYSLLTANLLSTFVQAWEMTKPIGHRVKIN